MHTGQLIDNVVSNSLEREHSAAVERRQNRVPAPKVDGFEFRDWGAGVITEADCRQAGHALVSELDAIRTDGVVADEKFKAGDIVRVVDFKALALASTWLFARRVFCVEHVYPKHLNLKGSSTRWGKHRFELVQRLGEDGWYLHTPGVSTPPVEAVVDSRIEVRYRGGDIVKLCITSTPEPSLWGLRPLCHGAEVVAWRFCE